MNSEDDDLDLLSFLNSNKKLVKSEIKEHKDQPPRKKIRISENNIMSHTSSSKIKTESSNTKSELSTLFNVEKISTKDDYLELALKHVDAGDDNQNITYCYLYGSWLAFDVEINDTVHILTEPEANGNYKVDDKSGGYIILNPHYILSGTAIISSLFCMRKSALNWKFKEQGAGNHHMVLGNILHGLFQQSITNKKYELAELKTLLMQILERKQIINQLYESDTNEEFILKETEIYLTMIEKWLHEHVKIPLGRKNNTCQDKKLQIQNVHDIEESIWSPKYGIKGKIDLTLQLEIKMSAYATLAKKTTEKSEANKIETHVVPVELKSGRTTFSAEHEGQVMLYSLLNKEKRKSSDFGLLLYLKDMKMKFIKVSENSIRGLIQLRNELVHYISSSKYPSLKNDERICSKCSYLTVCSLFNTKTDQPASNELAIYSAALAHLTNAHQEYFFKWYTMLEYEFKDEKQFDSGNLVWWRSKEELEEKGFTVFDLQYIKPFDMQLSGSDYTGEGFYSFEFKKTNPSSSTTFNLKANDMILLTSQTDNLVGIAQGFIRAISGNNTVFSLLVDKNLALSKISKDHLFRIEKINFRSAIQLNYTNLGKLMDVKHAALRSFIIDRVAPEFDSSLSKQNILKTKSLFKNLNQSQQAAILKAMMARDFLLIKGYPGTGKTTTIAALIAILAKLEKKVLFCCFTNSAVDNLLLKVAGSKYEIDFLRIGSHDKIHPDIQPYELSAQTAHIKDTKALEEFYLKKQLIATTCSSITHAAFSKNEFDYCIIDEASQVLLTTCLGPLFSAKKFILVGDLEQLPPIVRNQNSREMGMNVSLFEWLDCKQSSVELVHQYRMNTDIMCLANQLTYSGKLKCVSEKTANAGIEMNPGFLPSVKSEKIKKIFACSVVFIDTSRLEKEANELLESSGTESKISENLIECGIVSDLCEVFYKNSECRNADEFGVIAPYNIQVNAILKKFSNREFFNNIEVSTVDQYQGRDKRVIIMSFTNNSMKDVKEFEILNDKRRLTVAITRAKEKLVLVGCIRSLMKYKELANLISYLREKDLIVTLSDANEIINFRSNTST